MALLSLLSSSPEHEPLLERSIAPEQHRVINLAAAIQNIEGYVRVVEDNLTSSIPEQTTEISQATVTTQPITPEVVHADNDIDALNRAAKAEARLAREVINVPKTV